MLFEKRSVWAGRRCHKTRMGILTRGREAKAKIPETKHVRRGRMQGAGVVTWAAGGDKEYGWRGVETVGSPEFFL